MGHPPKATKEDVATTVGQYIAGKLHAIVGTGCRFNDQKMLFKVSREVARQFHEPEALFPNPGGTPCNQRQIKLLSALLGLTHREYYLTLCPLAIDGQKGTGDREKKEIRFSRENDDESGFSYDEITRKVDAIINDYKAKKAPANTEVAEIEIKEEAAPPNQEQLDFQKRVLARIKARGPSENGGEATAVAPEPGTKEAPEQPKQDAPEEKNGHPSSQKKSDKPERRYADLLKKATIITKAFYLDKTKKEPETEKKPARAKTQEQIKPKAKNALPEIIDIQATNGHSPKHEVETSPQVKINLKFPDNKRGNELITYAREKNITFGALLEEIRSISGGNQNSFAHMLGLDRSQYGKFVRNEQKKPPLPLMNGLADMLGTKTEDNKTAEENRVQWRQFILNIPAEVNQEKISHCLDADSPINTEHTGFAHRIALAKFFTLLAHRHGLVEWTQLANAIATHAVMDKTVAVQLQRAMDSRAGPQGNAELDPSQIEADRLASYDNRGVKMPEPLADIITKFAFPGDEARQKACSAFLTSDKYLMPEAEEKAHKSKAMQDIRKARGERWGESVNKNPGEMAIE